ncbi:hypothetical protein PCANC_27605 [Puccinia coronata f. sp. avenae]|uniref:Uncharacterized protein n=1 Tax=Puccinia coronata f. sp. avenae TaxID=200324 RepID=A0A2N5TLF4_9BASI|nr:hypothetical protein PCANC_27605 [Puccinia coronata f. sp. avenae]
MRVSCIFVSLAVLLAQQASAAPVIGLPALPLLDGEGRLVNGLSDTLGPIPIAGPLVGDLLESKSRGGLLSTLDVTGKYGLINDHGFASDLGRSLFDRRDEVPIAGPIFDEIPGVSQLESLLPLDAFSGINDFIESLPGMSNIESLEQAIPLPNLSKRDLNVQALVSSILAQVPGGQQIESMIPFEAISSALPSNRQIQTAMPHVEALIPKVQAMIPQVEAMIPQVVAMAPQVEGIVNALAPQVEGIVKSVVPNLSKRGLAVQALVSSILAQVPGGQQIESMIPFDAIYSALPSKSQVQTAMPHVEALIPKVQAMIPQVEAMIPQVLAMAPQAEGIVNALAPQAEGIVKSYLPNLAKRDLNVQALVNNILAQVSGGQQIESMIPFDTISSVLPSKSQVQTVMPHVEALIPKVQAMIPQVEAMIPQVLAMAPQVEGIVKSIALPN